MLYRPFVIQPEPEPDAHSHPSSSVVVMSPVACLPMLILDPPFPSGRAHH